jgi:hypothetical protein
LYCFNHKNEFKHDSGISGISGFFWNFRFSGISGISGFFLNFPEFPGFLRMSLCVFLVCQRYFNKARFAFMCLGFSGTLEMSTCFLVWLAESIATLLAGQLELAFLNCQPLVVTSMAKVCICAVASGNSCHLCFSTRWNNMFCIFEPTAVAVLRTLDETWVVVAEVPKVWPK